MNIEIPSDLETPDSLWETFAYFLQCLFKIHGTPKEIAEKNWLKRSDYEQLAAWLFRCEELFRRLLFVDAITYHAQVLVCAAAIAYARQFVPSRGSIERRTIKPMSFDPDHPEKWRVSFNLSSSQYGAPASRRHAPAPEGAAPAGEDAGAPYSPAPVKPGWPLARRVQALYNAALDRVGQGKRMARWLATRLEREAQRLAQPTRTRQQQTYSPGDGAVDDAAKLVKYVHEQRAEKLREQIAPPPHHDSS